MESGQHFNSIAMNGSQSEHKKCTRKNVVWRFHTRVTGEDNQLTINKNIRKDHKDLGEWKENAHIALAISRRGQSPYRGFHSEIPQVI